MILFIYRLPIVRWTTTVRASYLFPGGDAEGATPVPIPNTEVKSFWADGTAGETLWESRMLPGFFSEPLTRANVLSGSFFVGFGRRRRDPRVLLCQSLA